MSAPPVPPPPPSVSPSPDSALSIAAARAALKGVEQTAAKLAMFSTEYEGKVELPSVGERRRGLAPPVDGDLVELYQYEKLTPNQVNDFLIHLDGELNPVVNPGGGHNAKPLLRRLELTPGTAQVALRRLAAPPQGK